MSVDSDNLLRHWGEHRKVSRRSFPPSIWWVLGVLAVAVTGLVVWLSQRTTAWTSPSGDVRFASCTHGGRVDGWCANLRVAADPSKPHGRTISLHVAVLPATRRPAAGALFYLEGGPGGAATASAISVNAFFAAVGRTRDLVMVDQRGVGGSSRLSCPNTHERSDAEAVTAYLRRCLARLDANPRLYTTRVAAADLEIVRRTLGYGKIDVFGGSYGATLAQAYVRRYRRSVRTVVLDGASLPDVRIYDVSARNAEHALRVELARCAAAPACRRAYPDTRRQLGELLARPRRLVVLPTGKVVLRPNDIAWTVEWLSETAENAAIIPYAVNAAAHGDYTMLASAHAQLGGSNLDPTARLVPFWSILCSEPWAAFDLGGTARAGRGSYLAEAALTRARLFRRACRLVPKGRVQPDVRDPVRAPVLLLAGGADPLDPTANLRGWRHVFPDGRLVVVRGAGHGTLEYACIQKLIARFVAHGSPAGLNPTCARHISLPPFAIG
jgi:pimeloyl-ACP methyl ester carboxylesterase